MSTQATTSPSSSRIDNDHSNTFTASGKAVVDWETPGAEYQCLVHPDPRNRHITFEACLENDMSQRLSFFRLRVPVRHKHLQDIVLYIHIPPDHIASIDWTLQYDAADPVRTKLSSDITRLRFNLHKPVQLIVPDREPLEPKKPAAACVIRALESLATALSVSVYLEHTTLSKARLQSIADAVQSGYSRPVPRYRDLHRLYKGIGGKSLVLVDENDVSTDSEVGPSVQVDSPPSYDEIGPGPPMPPLALDSPRGAGADRAQGKRYRQCSGASTQNDDSLSSRPSKRGALDKGSGLAEAAADEDNVLPPWAHRLFAELAEVKECVVRQSEIIKDLQDEVVKLRTQEKTREDEYAVLEQRVDKTEMTVADLDATVTQHGESLADSEDNFTALWECCDEFSRRRSPELEDMREELRADVMARLRNALASP
ncbi:uncharacterized protein BCR38DRAFT_244210 [Pseudomassariella vexata]|uniref:Uncharacterized protein n=1 Tax=Pseudomassariella vexata TaxID=1141098 RepID=A0A1Y2DTY0_9PEZI|nr:uncharacterized protein BCR38DRAFT_244210 [Pseudomassariella vexata]ORY62629.1 hypothetical protein BCR38DRAFT_244210 [Pseudomassariella vexata]